MKKVWFVSTGDFAAIRAEAAECRELEARIAKVRASTV
jgi:hypothetical protein